MMKQVFALGLLWLSLPLLALEEGYASWYGGKFNGRLTANGEIYDMNKLTAAHKTLPFGTRVRVTNRKNGKQTVVRINDRGPFVKGRIIDLSRAAAEQIDMLGDGVAYVLVEVLRPSPGPDAEARYVIQVAAYKNEVYAFSTRERLEAAGLRVCFERSAAGYIRVLVCEVSHSRLEEVKVSLGRLQFRELIVRQMATD